LELIFIYLRNIRALIGFLINIREGLFYPKNKKIEERQLNNHPKNYFVDMD